IDYLAFSGHKIYAPFGSGVLIGPRKTFLQGEPEYSGGGTVDLVSRNQVWWTGLPEREEAGSPNVIGAFTLARSLQYLQKIGIEKLALYEE
ncbi:MAG TPA: aminotransferase, partial [Syntrophomonas wolfei]|nr:aminotransferase [Syntrophomonas wolfei]